MNYLAHLVLSRHDEQEMVGNVLGDFVRGRLEKYRFAPAVLRGVRLHRAIDAFTDFHPLFLRSAARVSEERGRFAGVLVDVFYDHFLSRDFERLVGVSVRTFVDGVYEGLERHRGWLPERIVAVMPHMREHDWLGSYATVEGIGETVRRMSRRFDRETPLVGSEGELRRAYAGFEEDFGAFWPQLVAYVGRWRDGYTDPVETGR